METSFFHELNGCHWAPPIYPALNSNLWLAEFEKADERTRKNIANAWLWLLNMEFKGADEHAVKRILIDTTTENYQWLRKAIPVTTTSLFSGSVFDGSLDCLLKYTAGVAKEYYSTFKRLLLNLWFGENQNRIKAVAGMSNLVTEHLKFNGYLPRLHNLVQNLAWDVVAENPNNMLLRAQAARISLMHGKSSFPLPLHESTENRAWHCMAQLSSMSAADPTTAFGLNTYEIITRGHPVVAATNLHLLTSVVPPNNIGAPTYRFKVGICQVVNKPLESITQFDVLRAWIPSKVKDLDIAEAMNMTAKEACEMIVNEHDSKLNGHVDIPDDLT